jgi:2-oxoisovalerate dehydrogenase E2 component (dihydrolipoyl transacylase)
MDLYEFKLPDIGEGTAEAECISWHVAPGDNVQEDQPLLDVMTDKATVEVTSPVAGIVVERSGEAGDMLQVGSTILRLRLEGDAPQQTEEPPKATDAAASGLSNTAGVEKPVPTAATPARRILATPGVRKRARELGIDLADVVATGPQGRVRRSDLETHLERGAKSVPAQTPAPLPAVSTHDEVDEVPVIGLRRKIAERMQDTKRRIPHFSYIEEVDVSQLERLRGDLNAEAGEDRPKLTILPFLIQALARTLPEFPQMNARYDDEAGIVRRHRALHVGIATQTSAGLVVPVIRNAERRDLWENALELARLSRAARGGKATSAELGGSTITITSLGALGGLATTPVINSPEVAIIGVNKMMERPVVRDGRIEVAKVMNLSASFDHRVIDGWDAALFVQRIKALIESPARLFVGLAR